MGTTGAQDTVDRHSKRNLQLIMITTINEFRQYKKIVNEGCSSYWPNNSDSTFDYINGELMLNLSKIVCEEMHKQHKKYRCDDDALEPDKKFWARQSWVDLVLTCLQKGFTIDEELMALCKQYVKSLLDDPDMPKYLENSSDYFRDSMQLILKRLNEFGDGSGFDPGFLDEGNNDDEERVAIDKKHK